MAYAIEHSHRGQVAVASGLEVVAGLWLFRSAFFIARLDPPLAWSCGIVGAVVVILAAIRIFGAYGQAWLSWVNALLGLWTILSPWIVSKGTAASTSGAVWNTVIVGIIILILAAWSAMATQTEGQRYDRTRTA